MGDIQLQYQIKRVDRSSCIWQAEWRLGPTYSWQYIGRAMTRRGAIRMAKKELKFRSKNKRAEVFDYPGEVNG